MTATPRTYLPPRQQTPPVQRIAKWALIGVTTLALAGSLYLFFRGTKPKRVSFSSNAAPATAVTPITDGWVRGLPDEPTATEPPAKPLPPVDEQARREVLRLQQQMRERDEQLQARLDEMQTLLQQQKPAPAPAATPKAIKRAPGLSITHDPNGFGARTASLEYILAAGATKIPCQIETAINSDVGTSYFTAKVTRPVSDTKTGQHVLINQNDTILGKDAGANLTFLSERLPTFSLTLARADGSEVELGDSPVTNAQGVNGLVSGVNHHWLRKYAAAMVMGVLRGGQLVVQTEIAQEAGVVLAQPSQVTERTLGRAIETRSTVWVNPGELCTVILLKPLSLTEVL